MGKADIRTGSERRAPVGRAFPHCAEAYSSRRARIISWLTVDARLRFEDVVHRSVAVGGAFAAASRRPRLGSALRRRQRPCFAIFSWLGRRSRAQRSSTVTPNRAEDTAVATKAAAAAPPPPPALGRDVPRTASPAVATNVPKPAPARNYAAPRLAVEPSAVSVEPPRPSLRAPLKPNIGATLPPTPTFAAAVLQKPNIAATLPPAPVGPCRLHRLCWL